MPQTILAYLALIIIMIASLNFLQGEKRTHDGMVRSEYEIMANAATIEQMQIISQGTDWADLDALNGTSTTISYTVGAFSVSFNMDAAVQYVDVNGIPSGTPTLFKEVALTSSNAKFEVFLVTHSRIFGE